MSNPNKQKGTRAETRVVNYLTAHGFKAERKALTGSKDAGDIQVRLDSGKEFMSLEVKSGKQTQNYNRGKLNDWLDQAETEGENCNQWCYLVIVRHGRKIEDAEVWTRFHHGKKIMYYLDDFVKAIDNEPLF